MTARSTTADRWVVRTVVVSAWLVACGVAFTRSTIPLALDGQVSDVRYVDNTGFRLRTLELVGGRRVVVDDAVARHLEPGDRIHKPAWSTTLDRLGSHGGSQAGSVALGPSGELFGFVVVGGTMTAVVWWLTARPAGTRREPSGGAGARDAPSGAAVPHWRPW